MSTFVVETNRLAKEFKQVQALQEVSLQIPKGEIIALLGANGAGKSTLLQILSGLTPPSSGDVHVLGMDIGKEPLQIQRQIGLLFGGESGLYHRLTAYENITYFADIHGIPPQVYQERIKEWAERLALTPHLHKKANTLSKGNQQKVAIIRTLIHDPDLIYFDEPTTGLDIEASLNFLDLVQEIHRQGKTIIFSTHILEEVTAIATEVIILRQGQVHFQDKLSTLYQQEKTDQLTEIMRRVIQGGDSQ